MRRGRNLVLLATAPLLALVLVLALGVGRGESASCEVQTLPEQARSHLAALPPGFAYNSFPPTSGPSGGRPLVWNEYRRPVSQFELVHNLLHGGIAVQYGSDAREAEIEQVRTWYREDPVGTIVAPLPRLGDRIALTAWRNLAVCDAFRQRAFDGFRARHRFNGPERPPRETMRPGRGGTPNPLGLLVTPAPVRGRAIVTLTPRAATTISIAIRTETASGPTIRRLATVSPLPDVAVRLTWDRRDDFNRRVPAGTYTAVAVDGRDGRVVSATAFQIR